MEKARANPFLFTRIQARLKAKEQNEWNHVTQIFARPAVVIATLLVVVLMNLTVFFKSSESSPSTAMQEDEQLFAKEYNFPDPSEEGFLTINTDEQP